MQRQLHGIASLSGGHNVIIIAVTTRLDISPCPNECLLSTEGPCTAEPAACPACIARSVLRACSDVEQQQPLRMITADTCALSGIYGGTPCKPAVACCWASLPSTARASPSGAKVTQQLAVGSTTSPSCNESTLAESRMSRLPAPCKADHCYLLPRGARACAVMHLDCLWLNTP